MANKNSRVKTGAIIRGQKLSMAKMPKVEFSKIFNFQFCASLSLLLLLLIAANPEDWDTTCFGRVDHVQGTGDHVQQQTGNVGDLEKRN